MGINANLLPSMVLQLSAKCFLDAVNRLPSVFYMPKIPYTIFIEKEAAESLDAIGDTQHLDGKKYAALIVSKFSDLKPEHGLDALSAIPKDLFRRGPGRPSTSTRTTHGQTNVALENVR